MNKTAIVKPKQRIVEASAKLFYGRDSNAVGVDMVCAVANVSKRTLYKHFSTKALLAAATLESLGKASYASFTDLDSTDPVERITHIFKQFEFNAEDPEFYGCVLMNASIELRGTDAEAKNAAFKAKNDLLNYFEQQATLLGAKNPNELAEQLLLLFDGCSAWIVMRKKFPQSTYKTLNTLLKGA